MDRRLEATELEWRCAYTSLVGPNAFIAGVDQESFERRRSFYTRELEHCCRTGEMSGARRPTPATTR